MERLFALLIGYAIGALLQTGYWYGRIKGIDIRKYGSGNAGTTNVMRTLGKKAGIITYFVDALKAVFTALVIHFLLPHGNVSEMVLVLYGGLGAVLGHNFPFYLNFKGGKGIAASSGFVCSLMFFPNNCWIFVVSGLIVFFGVAFGSGYVSLGSLVFMGSFFVEFVLFAIFGQLPVTGIELYESIAIVFIISALAFVRHWANIVRLKNGNERRMKCRSKEA